MSRRKKPSKVAQLRDLREAQFREAEKVEPTIDPEFRDCIPALTEEEKAGLEASIRADGCRDPLVLWAERGILLDGHNRLAICQRHGLAYATVSVSLPDREAALDWIDANAVNRRNLTADQVRMIRGRRYNRLKRATTDNLKRGTEAPSGQNDQSGERTAEKLAAEHGVSEKTIRRDGAAVAAIDDDAGIKRDVMAGKLSLHEAARQSTLKKKIQAFPEDERPKAEAFLNGVVDSGNHTAKAVELAEKLLGKPEEERVRIYVLNESDDPRERSLALTEAADLPPMPHPALGHLRDALRALSLASAKLDGFPLKRVDEFRSGINDILSSLKESAA